MRLIFFFTFWDIFGELEDLKEGKKDKFIANEKYSNVYLYIFLYLYKI